MKTKIVVLIVAVVSAGAGAATKDQIRSIFRDPPAAIIDARPPADQAELGTQAKPVTDPTRHPGPFVVTVSRVIDGDTIEVTGPPFSRPQVIRLARVDTPEKRGKCPEEKMLANMATNYTAEHAKPGSTVTISDLRPDKYPQRIVAEVTGRFGEVIADRLISSPFGVEYHGGRKVYDWCAENKHLFTGARK